MTYLLFIILGIVFVLLRSSRFKGYIGERRVRIKIGSLIRGNSEYSAFHDVTLPTPDGTTQIDHILVSPYGIFVIETKNLKGWIFGGANQKVWTQSLYGRKYKFQNPTRQNYKHVRAVQSFLSVNVNALISVVVFVGNSKFKTSMPENVIELRSLLPYLYSYKQQILSEKSVYKYKGKFTSLVYYASTNKHEHVKNVRQNREKPICHKCGKPMVLRTVRQGPRAGSKFC